MKALFFIAFLLLSLFTTAQLINNSAVITISHGGHLICEEDFNNPHGGILINDGRLEVGGTLRNMGSYSGRANDDSVIISGAGPSLLQMNGSRIKNLLVNKAADSDSVFVSGSLNVTGGLMFLRGRISTQMHLTPDAEVVADASVPFDFRNGSQIVGKVRRTAWRAGSFAVFNHPAFQIRTAANVGQQPNEIVATMLPGGNPSLNEREVNRYFFIKPLGGWEFLSDVRLPYENAELNNNFVGRLVPWHLNGTSTQIWHAAPNASANPGAGWAGASGILHWDLDGEWKLADHTYTIDAKAILGGAWNGSQMNAGYGNLLPQSQPFTDAPFNHAGNEAIGKGVNRSQVVDWVLVELRQPASINSPQTASSNTIIGWRAGLLLRNGTIVEAATGLTTLQFAVSRQGPAYVVVRHRNHLGAMSRLVYPSAQSRYTADLTRLENCFRGAAAGSAPVMLLAGNTYGLWPGDIDQSGFVNVSDQVGVQLAIQLMQNGYLSADVNLNGAVNATDLNLVQVSINAKATTSVSLR